MNINEWLVILLVSLIVFGPQKLPHLAKTLAKIIRKTNSLQTQWQQWWHHEWEKEILNHREQLAHDADKHYQEADRTKPSDAINHLTDRQ